MMNILITGANGQLGSELRTMSKIYPNYTYFFTDYKELDICKKESVEEFMALHSIDLIINCAAYTAVDLAEDNPIDSDKINHMGIANLGEVAEETGAGLIHFSTDYVFDGTSHKPYTEEDPTSAKSIYGITKLAGERVLLAKCSNSMVIRTSWLYSSIGNNFVKAVIGKLSKDKKMNVIFDQIGTPTYARDLAAMVFTIIEKGITPGVFHFSNEGVCSWYDFAKMIQYFAGIEGYITPITSDKFPSKAARPHFSVLDKSKIKETYEVEIPFWLDSLEDCIKQIK